MSSAHEDDIRHVGSIDGAEIALQAQGRQQTILVQQSEIGQHLVRFLGLNPADLEITAAGDMRYWRVPHDPDVDRRLKETVDILISIRYLHPTFVQLRMELT